MAGHLICMAKSADEYTGIVQKLLLSDNLKLVKMKFLHVLVLVVILVFSYTKASVENTTAAPHPGGSRRVFLTPNQKNCASGTVRDRQGYCRRVFDD